MSKYVTIATKKRVNTIYVGMYAHDARLRFYDLFDIILCNFLLFAFEPVRYFSRDEWLWRS